MPTVTGRGQKVRLAQPGLGALSERGVFKCHVTARAWAPPLSPPQVLRCGLEAPAPADSLEHGRCGRLGRCPFPVTPSRRDARTRRGPTGSVISRQVFRVLSPRWALGDPGADRNRGGGGGGRLPEGRDPGERPRPNLVLQSLRGAAAARLRGRRGLPVGQGVPCTEAGPLELESVSQRTSPPHPPSRTGGFCLVNPFTHFTLLYPRP